MRFTAITLAILLAAASPALALDGDFFVDAINKTYKNYKRSISGNLSASEQKILNRIRVRVTSDKAFNAVAYRDYKGRRYIEIPLHFISWIQYFHQTLVIASHVNASDCAALYLRQAADHLAQMRSAGAIPHLGHLPPFESYADHVGGECEHLRIDKPDNYAEITASYMDSFMSFLYGHEIAHHILGHLDKRPNSPEESQRREILADDWSMRMAATLPNTVIYGVLPLMAILIDRQHIEGSSLTTNSHPPARDRARRMIRHIVEFNDSGYFESNFGFTLSAESIEEFEELYDAYEYALF